MVCLLVSVLVVVSPLLSLQISGSEIDPFPPNNHCEPIAIPLCRNIQYNLTIMPNLLNHQKQEEAALEAHQYFPLNSINCSPNVQLFLCSLFAPVCTILDRPLPPCRSLCLSVRAGCEQVMNQFGFKWPDDFECSRFPETSTDSQLCFGENATSPSPSGPPLSLGAGVDTRGIRLLNNAGPPVAIGPGLAPEGGKDFGFVCPVQLKMPKSDEYSLQIGGKRIPDCAAPCHDLFFNEEEIEIARNWIAVWSFLCVASCLFTVLTFAIDTDRFKYPERPIIFLGVCYLVVGIVYVIGYFSGTSVSCREPVPTPEHNSYVIMPETIMQGTKRQMCTFLFMLLYFFNMASSVWWVVLTLTWFLAAGLKWGHEAIEAHSQYFHAAAWGVPALKTIVLLAMGSVEGDILSGVCYVGLWNVDALRHFVLAPLAIYLVLGIIFLMAGFVSLFRIRTVMRHDGTKTDKLEKLMLRIGIFSVLYLVPALFVIGCLFYEQNYQEQWMLTWHAELCPKYSIPCPPRSRAPGKKPEFAVFMVKYFMALIVGITSSVWVWSGKTVASWTKFLHRIRGTRTQAYV